MKHTIAHFLGIIGVFIFFVGLGYLLIKAISFVFVPFAITVLGVIVVFIAKKIDKDLF